MGATIGSSSGMPSASGKSTPKSGNANGWKSSSSSDIMSGSLSVSDVSISGSGALSLSEARAIGSSMSDNPFSEDDMPSVT
ncbi:hypothetical protein HanIR_Chr14g0698451 [Helianthus annuus]|nr:hypothetical protein HanIR_Chr14g0698451 [Helianthus annuus]